MSKSQYMIYKNLLSYGLAMANKGNPFWTQGDAMQAFAVFHKNARAK